MPYTLDTEADLRAAAAAAVDEVITNDPVARRPRPRARARRRSRRRPAPPSARPRAPSRTLEPIEAYDPAPGAPRVFAMQFKQDVRHVVTYASFRDEDRVH